MRGLRVSIGSGANSVDLIDGVDLSLAPGRRLALVGESGSGKSLTATALMGLVDHPLRSKADVLRLGGVDLARLSPQEWRKVRGPLVSMVQQDPLTALSPVFSAGSQVAEAARSRTRDRKEAMAQAIERMREVGIPDPAIRASDYPHQLSGGLRQRVAIAMALASEPSLMIADEPTTALDVTVQAEILDLMRNLHKRLDSAILLITHDMGVVADLADRIMVMRNGKVVEVGTVSGVFSSPQHPYTKQLLEAVPNLGEGKVRVLDQKPEAQPVLSLRDVAIEYPKRGRIPAFRAAEGVTLDIFPGEILGLVGESGSGKTTIGRAAVGLLPIAEGTLVCAGHDISKADDKALRPIRRKTGIVFQDPASSLNPRMPIGQSIGEPLLLAGEAKGTDLDRRVEKLLDQVELPRSYRNRYPHELSGGQRQRVGIARALALSPDLLVADEPTSALDVSVQARFLDLLQELQHELQFACLFISHDLAVVDLLSHRIAVMHRGKIVEQGPRDEILRNPKEAYTQRLIAAVPVPDPERQRERREQRVR